MRCIWSIRSLFGSHILKYVKFVRIIFCLYFFWFLLFCTNNYQLSYVSFWFILLCLLSFGFDRWLIQVNIWFFKFFWIGITLFLFGFFNLLCWLSLSFWCILFILLVSEPPTVGAVSKSYRPIRGRTVTLTCNINEGTRFWWKRFKGGIAIDIDSNKSTGKTTPSLRIRNIQAVDDGNYRCYGENEFGSTYDTVRVSSVGK